MKKFQPQICNGYFDEMLVLFLFSILSLICLALGCVFYNVLLLVLTLFFIFILRKTHMGAIFLDKNVVFLGALPPKYYYSKFHVNEIDEIFLVDKEDRQIPKKSTNWSRVTIVFLLKSGRKKVFNARRISVKKFSYMKNEILSLRDK